MADFNFFLNRQGPKGAQGVKGDTGFSPTIAPSADNDGLTTYKLVITNENNTYETDNLMGNLDITDDGGTYLRYNREAGSVSASEADTATASAAGVVRLADSTDYTNLADDAVITPSSFVDNYNSIFSAGSGIGIYQNLVDDKIVISIDDSTVVTETDLASALSPYATKSMLSDYVTSSNLSSTLANYVTNSNLTSTLANYVTSSNLSSTLANYVTNSSLSSTLASYVTSSALGTTLSDYVTDTELGTALNSYVKNTSLTTTLRDYATLDTEQTITATKRFEAEQFIGAFHIGNAYQCRISSIGENLTLISRASSTGDATVDSTILYMGSGSFSVSRGPNGTSYSLIDTSTGLIPDARLSSNIARTTDIPSIATSVSSSSTNAETVGAKLFYDTCGDIETLINSL